MNDLTPTHVLQHATALTVELVAAYVARNAVPPTELPGLIRSVHATIAGLGASETVTAPAEPLRPAVPIKHSVQPDHIVCLDDGLRFKSLKRHLGALGMTPEQYRAKWSLPADFPMVCPNYAEVRSQLAKSIGLGRKAAPVLAMIETEAA